jgi:hypothetical protein
MANRNANKGNAIKTDIATTETILPNDQLNDQKTEIMQDQTDIANDSETLPQTENIANDSDQTPQRTKEDILSDIVAQKLVLRTIEDKYANDPENEEITKQEMVISKLKDELKDYKKIEEKNRLRSEYNAKYAIAFNDLKDKLSLSDDVLNGLIANAKDDTKKDTLKSSFEIVFGKIPVFIAENVKGTSLNKSSANSDGKLNLAKMIKEMIEKGNTQDEIVSAIQENSDLDLAKSKKRYTDTKWQYEQSLKK